MPSTVHRSAAMTAQRLALVSQNVTEQNNGLVEVDVQYTAAATDRSRVLPLFKTDEPPPIAPDIVDLDALQTRRLYLRHFSAEKSRGLIHINASYVGANFTALRSPAIFSDFTLFNFRVYSPAYYDVETFGQQELEEGNFLQLKSGVSVAARYDYYGFDCNLRVEEQQAAVIDRQQIVLGPPPAFSQSNREGLVMGAAFNFRYIDDAYNPATDTRLSGWRYRDMTASQILAIMAQKQGDGTSGFAAVKTQKIDHITPTVKLISDVYQAELNTTALGNLGFGILQ